jgi:hypothetical protein
MYPLSGIPVCSLTKRQFRKMTAAIRTQTGSPDDKNAKRMIFTAIFLLPGKESMKWKS